MNEAQANEVLRNLLDKGIFEDRNTQFVGVFESEESPGQFEVQMGVNNLSLVTASSPFHHVRIRDRFVIKSIIKKEILGEDFAESIPDITITDTPKFYGVASRPDARRNGAIGNYYITGSLGTLGAFFTQNNSREIYFISNWHALTNQRIKLGSPIIQPRDVNRLRLRDKIGSLHSYYLDEQMDVAIGILKQGISIPDPNKLINGFDLPTWGMMLSKKGAATRGFPAAGAKILSINCSVRVFHKNYPRGQKVFHNQIMTEDMAAPMDSGSISVDQNSEKAIGLIFADNGYKYTMHNPLYGILAEIKPAFTIQEGVNKGTTMPELNFNDFI